jgi:hypothetical protein
VKERKEKKAKKGKESKIFAWKKKEKNKHNLPIFLGLTNTCNRAEGGACSRGDECGSTGSCIPHW